MSSVYFLSYSWSNLSKSFSTYFVVWGFRHLLISSKIEFSFVFLLLFYSLLVAWDNSPGKDEERLTLPHSNLLSFTFFLQKENAFMISLNLKLLQNPDNIERMQREKVKSYHLKSISLT